MPRAVPEARGWKHAATSDASSWPAAPARAYLLREHGVESVHQPRRLQHRLEADNLAHRAHALVGARRPHPVHLRCGGAVAARGGRAPSCFALPAPPAAQPQHPATWRARQLALMKPCSSAFESVMAPAACSALNTSSSIVFAPGLRCTTAPRSTARRRGGVRVAAHDRAGVTSGSTSGEQRAAPSRPPASTHLHALVAVPHISQEQRYLALLHRIDLLGLGRRLGLGGAFNAIAFTRALLQAARRRQRRRRRRVNRHAAWCRRCHRTSWRLSKRPASCKPAKAHMQPGSQLARYYLLLLAVANRSIGSARWRCAFSALIGHRLCFRCRLGGGRDCDRLGFHGCSDEQTLMKRNACHSERWQPARAQRVRQVAGAGAEPEASCPARSAGIYMCTHRSSGYTEG